MNKKEQGYLKQFRTIVSTYFTLYQQLENSGKNIVIHHTKCIKNKRLRI